MKKIGYRAKSEKTKTNRDEWRKRVESRKFLIKE